MQTKNHVTSKSGIISKDEKWCGDIFVEDDVVIASGVSVTVLPGAKIKFAVKKSDSDNKKHFGRFNTIFKEININTDSYTEKVSIIVYGSFFARGEKDSRIIIGNNHWDGSILVMPEGKIDLENIILRYSFGIFLCGGAKLSKIKNSVIEQNCFSLCSMTGLIVKNTVIRFNEAGIICCKKSLIALNHVYSNTYYGIFIKSVNGYVSKNIITLNDTGILCSMSAGLKIIKNYINGNITGMKIQSSYHLLLNNIVSYSNEINIVVEQCSSDITVYGLIIMGIGINVKDFSEVNMEKAHIVVADYGIINQNGAKVVAYDIDCFGNTVNVTGVNNSMTVIKESSFHSFHANVIMHQEALFFADQDNLISDQRNILSFAASANISVLNCNIESKDLFCHIELFSEIYNEKNSVKTGMFCDMSGSPKMFLSGTLLEAARDIFYLSGKSKAYIYNSNVKTKSVFCSLSDRSEIEIQSSIVYAEERFCAASDRTLLKVYDSHITSLKNILEISGMANAFVLNTSAVNESECIINLRDNAYINLTDSVLIGANCISEKSCAVAELSNVIIKTAGFLLDFTSAERRCLNSLDSSILKCQTLK
ncbi:MAG: NosD domain-containing protein, partial [Endomicrobiaceae bacterium]